MVTALLLLVLAVVSELAGYLAFVAYFRLAHEPFPAGLRFHPLFHNWSSSQGLGGNSLFEYDPILGYRYRPNTSHPTIGGPHATLSVCGEGFIDNTECRARTPRLATRTPGVRRVFILGGSTVAGYGASGNRATIAAYLERELNARRPGERYEVLNFGTEGYTSTQELLQFENDVVRYTPDLVIFYDGVNDVTQGTELGGYVSRYTQRVAPMNFQQYYLYLTRVIESRQDSLVNIDATRLLEKFYTTTLLMKAARSRIFGAPAGRGMEAKVVNSPSEVAGLYLQNVQNAIAVATYRKIPIAYFLQPTIWNKPASALNEGADMVARERAVEGRMLAFQGIVAPALTRLEASFGGEMRRRVKVKALLDLFAAVPEPVFLDSHHTNDRGNAIIARRILQEVWPLLHPESAGAYELRSALPSRPSALRGSAARQRHTAVRDR